jgi:hypothetical protein
MLRIPLKIDALSVAFLIAFFGFSLWTVYAVFLDDQVDIIGENGLIENVQVFLLVIAAITYLLSIFFGKSSEKLILCLCSLLCCSFALRELDVENFDIPNIFIVVGSGAGRDAILGTGFVVIFIYAVAHLADYKKAAVKFLRSRAGLLLVAGGMGLCVGYFFAESDTFVYHVYFEEMAELFGYFVILLSSLAARSLAG